MVEWQRQNEASVHRTAEKFADDRKRVREWCQCYSTLEGQTRGVLGKHRRLRYVHLCQSILTIEFLEDKKSEGRSLSNQPRSVIIMSLCQHLGVVPEEGAYTRDKMSDPAYKVAIRERRLSSLKLTL